MHGCLFCTLSFHYLNTTCNLHVLTCSSSILSHESVSCWRLIHRLKTLIRRPSPPNGKLLNTSISAISCFNIQYVSDGELLTVFPLLFSATLRVYQRLSTNPKFAARNPSVWPSITYYLLVYADRLGGLANSCFRALEPAWTTGRIE